MGIFGDVMVHKAAIGAPWLVRNCALRRFFGYDVRRARAGWQRAVISHLPKDRKVHHASVT